MEEIIQEKANFLTQNRTKLISNLQSVKYSLFKILVSDTKLEETDEYNKIISYLETKENNTNIVGNEIYLISSIASFLDRTPMNYDEKKNVKQKLYRYNSCYDMEKEEHIMI